MISIIQAQHCLNDDRAEFWINDRLPFLHDIQGRNHPGLRCRVRQ